VGRFRSGPPTYWSDALSLHSRDGLLVSMSYIYNFSSLSTECTVYSCVDWLLAGPHFSKVEQCWIIFWDETYESSFNMIKGALSGRGVTEGFLFRSEHMMVLLLPCNKCKWRPKDVIYNFKWDFDTCVPTDIDARILITRKEYSLRLGTQSEYSILQLVTTPNSHIHYVNY
jgi:hypothetical protein